MTPADALDLLDAARARADARLDALDRRVGAWAPAPVATGMPERRPLRPAPQPDTARHAAQLDALDDAVDGLWRLDPEMSARTTFTARQRWRALVGLGVLAVAVALAPVPVCTALVAACVALYLSTIAFRLRLFRLSLRHSALVRVSDDEALAVADRDLPVYTVLVPAYHEPEVAARLLRSIGALDYPADKLDVKLLLEADDEETLQTVLRSGLPPGVEVVTVPAREPRTKPKALNVGLRAARGELLTIYDAEDRPEPLQLRRAAVALARLPEQTACVQARLAYFNPGQNIITRWFSLEYRMWFSQFLPGLSALDAPVPLGGTSNHFRVAVLRELGGWDPYNVTEDADLGVRLHRRGYRTGVLDSETLEEANSDFVNWVKQRSRWYKGYLQTWLVHMRRPVELARGLGLRGFVRFNLFVGGTPFLALLNPVFWLLTLVWFAAHPHFIEQVLPGPVYYAGVAAMVVGNFLFLYAVLLTAVEADDDALTVRAVLAVPVYWVMMSMAAAKAFWQLATAPTHWEKTTHGLDQPHD